MPTQTVSKGRRVSGPRTKLAAEVRLESLEKAVIDLAESVAIVAKAIVKNEDDMMASPPVEDDEMSDEDADAPIDLADDFDGDFTPYGDETDAGSAANEGEDTENELGIHDGDLTKALRKAAVATGRTASKARVRKDDAASSFGEKDDDITGNRPLDSDNKGRPAEDYLIQGDSGDGPGPVNKALLNKAVRDELARMGIVRKARSPRPADSQIGKADDEVAYTLPDGTVLKGWDAVRERARGMSFQELNRMRIALGDMPAGIL